MFMLLKAKQLFFGPRTFPLIKKENFYHLKTVLNFHSDKVILNDMIPFNCGKKKKQVNLHHGRLFNFLSPLLSLSATISPEN